MRIYFGPGQAKDFKPTRYDPHAPHCCTRLAAVSDSLCVGLWCALFFEKLFKAATQNDVISVMRSLWVVLGDTQAIACSI